MSTVLPMTHLAILLRRGRPTARAVAAGLLLVAGLIEGGCASTPEEEPAGHRFPAWVDVGERRLAPAPELEEAAALLCSLPEGNVDEELRRLVGLYDGQLTTGVARGDDVSAVRQQIEAKALVLFDELGATHAGFAESAGLGGKRCAAAVGARRLVEADPPLPAEIEEGAAFPVALGPSPIRPVREATLYLQDPRGFVQKRALSLDDAGRIEEVIAPSRGPGRYILEVLTVGDDGAPEVAVLWPFLVGEPPPGLPAPPYPAVLFGDEGHGDLALSHRAEALIQRLRTQQEIPVLRIAPPLSEVAGARAASLSEAAALGHLRPEGRSPVEDVMTRAPGFGFSRLAEIQAQAGDLKSAWRALLSSPAHRFELVHPAITHFGAAVRRGEDGAGRPLVTVVALFAKRIDKRRLQELRTELAGKLNLARHGAGHQTLAAHPALDEVCGRLVEAMARTGALDEGALGEPVAERALAESGLDEVRVQVAALDDPLRLKASGATLRPEAGHVGIGLLPEARGGRWMLCVLVGTGADRER